MYFKQTDKTISFTESYSIYRMIIDIPDDTIIYEEVAIVDTLENATLIWKTFQYREVLRNVYYFVSSNSEAVKEGGKNE